MQSISFHVSMKFNLEKPDYGKMKKLSAARWGVMKTYYTGRQ